MNYDPLQDDALHSYSFILKTKPYGALESLCKHFMPESTPFSLPAGSNYFFNQGKEQAGIIMLSEGIGSICHCENGMHISTLFSPSILGLVDGYSYFYDVPSRPKHYIHAETDCRCHFIKIDVFLDITEKNNLWHDIARVLAHRLMIMSMRERELVGVDSYLMVRSLLIELWIYPEEYRNKISVLSFIMKRTGLSRSRVMAILSELKKGEYIEVKAGKLIMQKKLPTAF